jgi:hypothetical protein
VVSYHDTTHHTLEDLNSHEKWAYNDIKDGSYNLYKSTISAFAWADCENTQKPSDSTVSNRVKIKSGFLLDTSLTCIIHF